MCWVVDWHSHCVHWAGCSSFTGSECVKSNETAAVLRERLNPIIEESQSELKKANHHAGNIIETANKTASKLKAINKDNDDIYTLITKALEENDQQRKVEELQTALEIIGNQTDAIQQAQEGAKNIQNDGQEIQKSMNQVRSNEDRVKDLYKKLIEPMIDELKELSSLKPIFDELILQAQVKNDLSFWLNASIILFTSVKLGLDFREKIKELNDLKKMSGDESKLSEIEIPMGAVLLNIGTIIGITGILRLIYTDLNQSHVDMNGNQLITNENIEEYIKTVESICLPILAMNMSFTITPAITEALTKISKEINIIKKQLIGERQSFRLTEHTDPELAIDNLEIVCT